MLGSGAIKKERGEYMRDLEEVSGEKYALWEALLGEYAKKPLHLGEIAGIPIEINLATVVATWVVMFIAFVVGVLATRNVSIDRPSKLQVIYETVHDFLKNLLFDTIENKKRAKSLITFILTLFTFILFCNVLGLFPGMKTPTADLSTTVGLALMVMVLVYILGFKDRGVKYLGHFFVFPLPHLLFAPINIMLNIIKEIAKPLTLSMRLFGNMFAGGLMVVVLLALIPPIANLLGGFIPSVIWLGFKIFVGVLQAFIFTVLTIVYISLAVNEHH